MIRRMIESVRLWTPAEHRKQTRPDPQLAAAQRDVAEVRRRIEFLRTRVRVMTHDYETR